MKILDNRRVYSNNLHNAFTDLILFEGNYYLAFRTGRKHMSNGGKLRVFQSADARKWKEMKFPNIKGDVRDCKFWATGMLNILFPLRNGSKVDTYSSVLLDGKWNYPILEREGWVGCRPKVINGRLLIPYYKYVHSNFDNYGWELGLDCHPNFYTMHKGDKINETELIPMDDKILVISRTEHPYSMIGQLHLNSNTINWSHSMFVFHAPCAKKINGKWIIAARDARTCHMFFDPDLPEKNRCWTEVLRIYELDETYNIIQHKINLFWGKRADCGYCGIAEDKKDKRNCYISYYRGDGGRADIYLARVRV